MTLASREWKPRKARDAPRALLLHGITGSSGTWWRVGPALADAGWRAIALDLPGHGDSPRMGRPMKAGEWAAAVRETLHELVKDEPIDLAVGHSAGAAALLEVVALEPGIARRVVLEDPPGVGDVSRLEWAAHLEREVAAAQRDPGRFEWLLLHENPTWEPQDASETVAALRACEIEFIAESERRGIGYRTADLVATLEAPSLLLLAEEGRSALVGEARERVLASVPTTMTTVEFPAGHVIHRDAFDDYVRTVVDWAGRPVDLVP
jgi:pimeloyl-ACP methyl ester carboxylesterase